MPAAEMAYRKTRLNVLHLAAGNRWTGAAAPAFAEVVALRQAGVDAHYAYVGGYKLQTKLSHVDYAHPIIAKAQNPVSFVRTAAAIERLIDHHHIDVVHAHLTYDHVLARMLQRGHAIRVVRTFHARRVIRRDPFTRLLIRASDLICVTNASLAHAAPIRDRHPLFTPPPLDLDQFTIAGPDVRARYGIPETAPLVTVIGKVSKNRGFELALATFAELRKRVAGIRIMIIGHGEHRPALERLAEQLGIADALTWAGYHEDDLADHYRASTILLFTASGSDEGHRAVLEATACGAVPVVAPLEGIEALVERAQIADAGTPTALADVAVATLNADLHALRARMAERCEHFSYRAAAARLIDAYRRIL